MANNYQQPPQYGFQGVQAPVQQQPQPGGAVYIGQSKFKDCMTLFSNCSLISLLIQSQQYPLDRVLHTGNVPRATKKSWHGWSMRHLTKRISLPWSFAVACKLEHVIMWNGVISCSFLVSIFSCWPCAWIPYVMDSCKNGNHYCPSCNTYIGTYKN